MLGTRIEKPLQDNEIREYVRVAVDKSENGEDIFAEQEITKPNPAPNTYAKYAEAAAWCNTNNAMIEDKGNYYEVVAVPAPTAEELAAQARSQRDALIAATDYLMATDYPLTDEKRQELTVYRQALRDVPEQPGFPTEIAWPVKPEWVK